MPVRFLRSGIEMGRRLMSVALPGIRGGEFCAVTNVERMNVLAVMPGGQGAKM
jgi:hypothetical protein